MSKSRRLVHLSNGLLIAGVVLVVGGLTTGAVALTAVGFVALVAAVVFAVANSRRRKAGRTR